VPLGPILKDAEVAVGGIEHAARGTAKALYPAPSYKEPLLTQEARAVERAAQTYDIKPSILWGVFGAETAHGSDVKTSSTGAVGPFQFEPETAKEYGYPTNVNVNGIQSMSGFQAQANAAAKYLASLLPGGKGETGLKQGAEWNTAWESALKAYSGGGYGLAHVVEEGKAFPAAAGYAAQGEDEQEHAEVEANPWTPEGYAWSKLIEVGLNIVLMLAGAALLVYGVMVMMRPRERAFSLPPLSGRSAGVTA
jgi:Transglycosylase SLT domain